jgi:hypothetical protein
MHLTASAAAAGPTFRGLCEAVCFIKRAAHYDGRKGPPADYPRSTLCLPTQQNTEYLYMYVVGGVGWLSENLQQQDPVI